MPTVETLLNDDVAPMIDDSPEITPQSQDWLVKVEGVSKKYCRDLRRSLWYGMKDVLGALTLHHQKTDVLREFEFWAIDNVSFHLRRGDCLGLLGRNGAGKSTLIKMISGQRSLSAGSITTRGRIVALTELGLGFDLALTGRENAYVNAAVHGYSREDFDHILEQIIDFSGIREFIDSAVQTYSTGMKARLGFSVATHLNPDILIVDEVLAVGDLEFRRKCVKHILKYVKSGGSIILVAHDPYLVQSLCNRCVVLDHGRLTFDGSGTEGVQFHFQVGRSNEFNQLSGTIEGADSSLSDAIAEAEAEEARDLAKLPVLENNSVVPLTLDVPISIDAIEVLSMDGGPIITGKTAKLLMHYRALLEADITWGFGICTSDLQTSIVSCAQGLDGDACHIEPGKGVLTAVFPNFPLQPGVYAARGGIGEAGSLTAVATKGYSDTPHFFTIVPGESSRLANYKVFNNDLVDIAVKWDT